MIPLRRRQFSASLAGGLALPALAFAKDTTLPVPASLATARKALTVLG